VTDSTLDWETTAAAPCLHRLSGRPTVLHHLRERLRRKPRTDWTDADAAESAYWREISTDLRQGGRGVIAR
jgi:hypothetical protein